MAMADGELSIDAAAVDPTDPEAAIAAAARRYSNWGRWGADDVRGTMNFLTEDKRVQGAALVRRGVSFSLAQSFDMNGPQKGWRRRTNPVHTMLDTGTDAAAGIQGFPHGLGGADDVIAMPLQCSTQWDGLGHIFDHGKAWNGRPAQVVSGLGDSVTGIETIADVVGGRGVLLDVARAVGARRFVHVSTAYVAGTHSGLFTEDMLGTEFRNTYEQTKFEAEQVVGATTDLAVAIARPSIVMGESDSGWTPAFNVLYWPLRAFARGLFDRVPAKPDGRVDVVPVDYVADGIAKLIEADVTGTFNLVAADDASTVDELAELACAHFGRPRPPYVDPAAATDTTAHEHGAVYLPYFDMEVVFDDTRTRDLLGMRAPKLLGFFDTLMDYADAARWGKRGTTREEARERVSVGAR